MGLAVFRQRKPQRFLGAGFADRTGDGDDLGLAARACGTGEIAQTRQHVRHDEQRRIGRKIAAAARGNDRKTGMGAKSRGDKLVAVTAVALDGEERFAGNDGAGIDGNPGNRLRQHALAFGIHRARHRIDGPQWRHAANSLSAMATAS